MGVDDLQEVDAGRDDDAEVAVAAVVVAQVLEERGGVAAAELVGRPFGAW